MVIKLLSKSELAKAKSNARKMEIDEGLKLAKRVDNLREVAAAEEASLEQFRRKTVESINIETTKAASVRDSLLREVASLQKKREELMKPLDLEWQNIEKEKLNLEKQRESINQRAATVQESERAVEKALKQVSNALVRAATKESYAEEMVREAIDNRQKTEISLAEAKRLETEAQELYENMRIELKKRDTDAAIRERNVTMKEAKLADREAELSNGWKLLEDRKEAFERTIKRSKK